MSNLIPSFAKKKITTEYWIRVVTVWFYLWGTGLIVATVLLFPVYIFTSVQIDVNAASASAAEANVENYEDVAFDLKKATLQARYIIEDDRRNKAHQYVDLFTRNAGVGVAIERISFAKTQAGVQPITISGQAESRETLAAFRDRLLTEPAIEQANLPISNLAKDRDIDFTITVTMNNQTTL